MAVTIETLSNIPQDQQKATLPSTQVIIWKWINFLGRFDHDDVIMEMICHFK